VGGPKTFAALHVNQNPSRFGGLPSRQELDPVPFMLLASFPGQAAPLNAPFSSVTVRLSCSSDRAWRTYAALSIPPLSLRYARHPPPPPGSERLEAFVFSLDYGSVFSSLFLENKLGAVGVPLLEKRVRAVPRYSPVMDRTRGLLTIGRFSLCDSRFLRQGRAYFTLLFLHSPAYTALILSPARYRHGLLLPFWPPSLRYSGGRRSLERCPAGFHSYNPFFCPTRCNDGFPLSPSLFYA